MPNDEENLTHSPSAPPRGKGVAYLAPLPSFYLFWHCRMVTIAGAVSAGEKAPRQSLQETDVQRLVGRWVRGMGDICLNSATSMRGVALQPPISTPGRSRCSGRYWSRNGGKISVLVVELRDINYPGSTYNLQYDAKSDRLTGTYFQAVERQTYDVQFMRTK